MQRFASDIQDMSTIKEWQQLLPCTFSKFWVLKLVGVAQIEPMHEFALNFQDMFSTDGSKTDYVLGSIE